jgi:WD40 repeat protein
VTQGEERVDSVEPAGPARRLLAALWPVLAGLAGGVVAGLALLAGLVVLVVWLTGLWPTSSGPAPAAKLTDPGQQGVTSVAFSPDGTLATGDNDGNTYLWDAATRHRIATLTTVTTPGPGYVRRRGSVTSVAFSPDGSMLATGDSADYTTLWDVATGRQIAFLPDPSSADAQDGGVVAVAFSPDGRMLATADATAGDVYLWDLATARRVAAFPDTNVTSVAFSPNGSLLATGDTFGDTSLWDIATGQLGATFTEPVADSQGIASVAFSPDGKMIALGDAYDAITYLRDVATGRLITSLTDPSGDLNYGGVTSVAFSPDGKFLATGDEDCAASLWSTATWQLTGPWNLPAISGNCVSSVAFSADSDTAAFGGLDGSTYLWRTGRGISR